MDQGKCICHYKCLALLHRTVLNECCSQQGHRDVNEQKTWPEKCKALKYQWSGKQKILSRISLRLEVHRRQEEWNQESLSRNKPGIYRNKNLWNKMQRRRFILKYHRKVLFYYFQEISSIRLCPPACLSYVGSSLVDVSPCRGFLWHTSASEGPPWWLSAWVMIAKLGLFFSLSTSLPPKMKGSLLYCTLEGFFFFSI